MERAYQRFARTFRITSAARVARLAGGSALGRSVLLGGTALATSLLVYQPTPALALCDAATTVVSVCSDATGGAILAGETKTATADLEVQFGNGTVGQTVTDGGFVLNSTAGTENLLFNVINPSSITNSGGIGLRVTSGGSGDVALATVDGTAITGTTGGVQLSSATGGVTVTLGNGAIQKQAAGGAAILAQQTGTGAALVSVSNAGPLTTTVAGGIGIQAATAGTGGVSVVNSGTIGATGTAFSTAVFATSTGTAGGVSVTNTSALGRDDARLGGGGIGATIDDATGANSGTVSVNGGGTFAIFTTSDGITARTNGTGDVLVGTTAAIGSITGALVGINASQDGTTTGGVTVVTATGATITAGTAIAAQKSGSATGVVSVDNNATLARTSSGVGGAGIAATSSGTSAVTVSNTAQIGTAAGRFGRGIEARITNTASNADVTVNGGGAIFAENAIEVTTDGAGSSVGVGNLVAIGAIDSTRGGISALKTGGTTGGVTVGNTTTTMGTIAATDTSSGISAGITGGTSTGTVLVQNTSGVTGRFSGIAASTINAGAVTVQGIGSATGTDEDGIFAISRGGTVTVGGLAAGTAIGSVTGATGISAFTVGASGTGDVIVANVTGLVTATTFNGINANTNGSGNVTVGTAAFPVNSITAARTGIAASTEGTGNVVVTTAGSVTGAASNGVFTSVTTGTAALNVLAGSTITGAGTGAVSGNNLTVLTSGLITGAAGANAIEFRSGANAITFGNTNAGTTGNIALGTAATTLNLAQGNGVDTTLGSAITGAGTVTKTGGNAIVLTGANTAASNFTGILNVNAGRIRVNGTFGDVVAPVTASVNVNAGGTVDGIGTIAANVSVNGGGTLAPGNSIGTLNVSGNVAFAAGSTFQVEVNAAGQGDRVAATGSATLTGGTVQVLASQGNYAAETRYTILTAAGGRTGQFASVTSNLAFLVPTLAYEATNVILTLTNSGALFSSVAESSNQFNVANAVSALGFGNRIFDAVLSRSAPEARLAFDRLSNEVSASTVTATFEVAGIVRDAILGRLRGIGAPGFGGLGLGPTASVEAAYAADLPGRRGTTSVPVPTLDPRVFALWGQGFGSFGATGSNGNAGRLTRETGGFVVGADATLDGITRFGLAAGYTTTSIDVRSRLSSGEIQSAFGALYAGTQLGPVNLRFGGVYAGTWSDVRRTVAFPGFSNAVRGRFGGDVGQVFGEAGYKIPLGAVTLEPFAGLAGVFISRDRYTETGGAAATTVFGRGYDLGVFTAGLRAEAALSTDWPLHLRGMIGYRHAFGDVVPRALVAFAGTAATFGVAGVPVDRHAVVAEAGLDWRVSDDLTIGLAYAGQVGNRAYDHGVKGSFVWRF